MRTADLEVFIEQRQPWSREQGVYIRSEGYVAEPLVFSKPKEGTMTPACFNLSNDAAQNFMDALWQSGFRPSEGTGSAGALKATQSHLDDMRKLVFEVKK